MTIAIDENKIVVFTGAGVSAESGIATFRGAGGLWNDYSIEQVATPAGWNADPELVLDFYNQRRAEMAAAQPNAAHLAIAELQTRYEVVVITQNIDDLHERAGAQQVIHLHGEIVKARSSVDDQLLYDIGAQPIRMGQLCAKQSQLRPHVVWFGETMLNAEVSRAHIKTAGRILVVGTSLSVYPAAGLLKQARYHAEKIIVAMDIDKTPFGFKFIRAKAANMVPHIVNSWLKGERVR